MDKDRFLDLWMQGGPAARDSFRADVEELLKTERARLADIVSLWHHKKGGYTELAERLKEAPIPAPDPLDPCIEISAKPQMCGACGSPATTTIIVNGSIHPVCASCKESIERSDVRKK